MSDNIEEKVFTDAAAPRSYIPAWEQLAADACEANPFFEHWMLLPAMEHLGGGGIKLYCLFDHNDGGKLVALLPLVFSAGSGRIPLTTISVWRHLHCGLATPLVTRGYEQLLMRSLLRWAKDNGAGLVELPLVDAEGQMVAALRGETTAIAKPRERETFLRASLAPPADYEGYLRATLPRKRRKEFNRLRSRLAERGELVASVLNHESDIERWIESFIELEESGWKGRAGTALRRRPGEERYFREVLRGAHQRNRLLAMQLALNGRWIAMKCDILANGWCYAYKITYDEEFAAYSPGVLLELDHIRELTQRSGLIICADSCAVEDHPMIDRLWSGRRRMVTLLVPSDRRAERILRVALPLASAWRRLRSWSSGEHSTRSEPPLDFVD